MQKQAPKLLERVGRFLDEVIESQEATALFFCNDVSEAGSSDKAAGAAVRGSMKNAARTFMVPNQYWSPQQMLSLIACCQATVSTRYHFCLFSALQGIPFIAIQRSDKVHDLCWDLQWPQGVPMSTADPAALLELYADIQRERSTWVSLLRKGSAHMRERALKNHDALDSLVRAPLA